MAHTHGTKNPPKIYTFSQPQTDNHPFTTFDCFPKLPMEVQSMVWHAALPPPRAFKPFGPDSVLECPVNDRNIAISRIASTCKQSQNICLRTYASYRSKMKFNGNLHVGVPVGKKYPTVTRVNLKEDALPTCQLSLLRVDHDLRYFGRIETLEIHEVNLAFDAIMVAKLVNIIQGLPSLTLLKLVSSRFEIHSRLKRFEKEWKALIVDVRKQIRDSLKRKSGRTPPQVLFFNPPLQGAYESQFTTDAWQRQWKYIDDADV